MRASIFGPALLLAASAVAQSTTEGIMTIQTSVPTNLGTSPVCYEDCIQPPCSPCQDPTSVPDVQTVVSSVISSFDITPTNPSGIMSIPEGETPLSTGAVNPTTSGGFMSIPEGETPLSTGAMNPTTSGGFMSIPEGETPLSTGIINPNITTGLSSIVSTGNVTMGTSGSPSTSGTAPAEMTSAAAPPSLMGDDTPYVFAIALSAVSVVFGVAWTLL